MTLGGTDMEIMTEKLLEKDMETDKDDDLFFKSLLPDIKSLPWWWKCP
jgi:hypothetical protein